MTYWIKTALKLLLICEVIVLSATYFLMSKTTLVLFVVLMFVGASVIYMVYKQYQNTRNLIQYYRFQHVKDDLYYAEFADLKSENKTLTGALVLSQRGITFLYDEHAEEKELFFPYDQVTYQLDKNLSLDDEQHHYVIRIIDQEKAKEALENRNKD